jgi:ribosomal protein S18 acetylase RimI-like enzyme
MEKISCKEVEFDVYRFSADDCKYPEKFLKYVNSLIDDPEAITSFKTRKTLEEERIWLSGVLSAVSSMKMTMLLAECAGNIIGGAAAGLLAEKRSHVAEIGISIVRGYRSFGLGSYMLERIIGDAKKFLNPGPLILRISTFSSNSGAISFYERHRFEKVARIPQQFLSENGLIDEVVMLRSI